MNDADRIHKAQQIVTAYSAGDWNTLKSLMAPEAIYDEIGSQRRVKGPDAIIQTLQGWKQAMTDSRGTVADVYASGNAVTLEVSWQGTHNGPLAMPGGTIPASGKRQTTAAAMIVKFQGDKIQEIRHYFDMVTLLQQIGAMPAATHA